MQLTQAQAQKLFVPLIALVMSGVMSLVLTAVHMGLGLDFTSVWLRQWTVGFAVALPTALMVVPLIRNGLARVTVPSSSLHSPTSPMQGNEPVIRASHGEDSQPQAATHVPLPATRGEGRTNGGADGGVRGFNASDSTLSAGLS